MPTITDVFKDRGQQIENRLTGTETPWDALQVKQRYTIFFTGRSGSTWLTEMLDQTGLCGRPEEIFNEEIAADYCRRYAITTFQDYLAKIVGAHKCNNTFGLEIDPLRYVHASKIIDVDDFFFGGSCKTIWLTRSDVLSQAYSFGVAKGTGTWHLRDGQTAKNDDSNVQLSDLEMWREIFFILESERFMKTEFARVSATPLQITYEDLVADKFSVIFSILAELHVPSEEFTRSLPRITDKMKQLAYSKKHSFLASFIERNWIVYRQILENRAVPNIPSLRRSLEKHRGIVVKAPDVFSVATSEGLA